jgi:plastocyanin domain-containing protein
MHSPIATNAQPLPRSCSRFLPATLLSLLVACSAGADTVSNQVQMAVTPQGFEPRDISVRMGEPVTLTITRKTDDTCATEIVIDEYGINTKLPLNQSVTIKFTPKKSGKLKYGCAMSKMIGGVITIRG